MPASWQYNWHQTVTAEECTAIHLYRIFWYPTYSPVRNECNWFLEWLFFWCLVSRKQIQIQAHVEDSDPQPAKVQAIFLSPQHLPGQLTMWSNLIWCARVPQAPIVDRQPLRFVSQLTLSLSLLKQATTIIAIQFHCMLFQQTRCSQGCFIGLWLIEQPSHLRWSPLKIFEMISGLHS